MVALDNACFVWNCPTVGQLYRVGSLESACRIIIGGMIKRRYRKYRQRMETDGVRDWVGERIDLIDTFLSICNHGILAGLFTSRLEPM